MFVADHIIKLGHQTAEIAAVPVNAERVRQGDPGLATCGAAGAGGLEERLLARRLVEEIAFEEQEFGIARHVLGHVLRPQIGRDAQIGVHRALAIGGDEDHAARAGKFGPRDRRIREIGTLGLQGPGVEAPQRIVAHPADESGLEPQIAAARQRVADRSARRLGAVLHRGIEHLGAFTLDQLHDALGDPHVIEEGIIGLGQHIDNGVADADHLIAFHAVLSSNGQRSLIRQSAQRGLRAVQI